MRFFFATAVILAHSYVLTGVGGHEPLVRLTGKQTDSGALAVDCFFAISGFLITISWLRSRSFVDYLIKRVLRIYPAFLVVSALCIFLVAPWAAANRSEYFHHLHAPRVIVHALLLDKIHVPPTFDHNPVPNEVNGSLWTIRVEFECYLLVAVFGALGLLKKRQIPLAVAAIAAVAFVGLAVLYRKGHLSESLFSHSRFVTYFMIGMAFALYKDKVRTTAWGVLVCVLFMVAACFAHLLEGLMPAAVCYCLFYVAFLNTARLHRFARYGDFSYGIYLYAWPVQQIIVRILGPTTDPVALFFMAFAVTLLCGVLSWFLVEKAALSHKPKSARSPEPKQDVQPALISAENVAPAAPALSEE